MDDAEHKYWSDYSRTLADQLGLKDWEIVVKRDTPEDSSAGASMMTLTGRRVVWFRLGRGFHSGSPGEKRHMLIHELVHVHLDDIDTSLWQAQDYITGDTFSLMRKIAKDRMEFAVDNIATAIASNYPLPETRVEGGGKT